VEVEVSLGAPPAGKSPAAAGEGACIAAPGVCAELTGALAAAGITALTPVQAETLPHLLDGKDCLAKAKTGTGKTMAFLIPTVQRLLNSKAAARKSECGADPIRAIVLSSARELATQILTQVGPVWAGSHLTSPHLTSTSPPITSPHLTSPHLTSPHPPHVCNSSHLHPTLPHFTSSTHSPQPPPTPPPPTAPPTPPPPPPPPHPPPTPGGAADVAPGRVPPGHRAGQGHTLVHFSAQQKHKLWDMIRWVHDFPPVY